MLDYALGEGMKQEVNDNVYRVAFESAKTELGEISATFEQLRQQAACCRPYFV